MNALRQLENHLESWVEHGLARWLRPLPTLEDVKVAARRALDHTAPQATTWHYTVRVHPRAAQALLAAHPTLLADLSADLVATARQLGLTLTALPTVHLQADQAVPPHRVVVTVTPAVTLGHTQTAPAAPVPAPAMPASRRAYLMLPNQTEIWPLVAPLVHLGRHPDNDLPLDHPLVSRHHAQLRLRHGRYVLYDLNSRLGSWVNGQRVREWVLHPGDVIRLGEVSLIYGEEPPQP